MGPSMRPDTSLEDMIRRTQEDAPQASRPFAAELRGALLPAAAVLLGVVALFAFYLGRSSVDQVGQGDTRQSDLERLQQLERLEREYRTSRPVVDPPTVTALRPQSTPDAPPASVQPVLAQPPTRESSQPALPVSVVAVPFSVSPQGMRQVQADMTCSGDVLVNGERWFDSDASTALVICFRQPAEVRGPYGFSCEPGDQRALECARKREFECFRACQPTDVFPR